MGWRRVSHTMLHILLVVILGTAIGWLSATWQTAREERAARASAETRN